MRTIQGLVLISLLISPLARADGPTDALDAVYREATATVDHHYRETSARADAEAQWSDNASRGAAADALATCGEAESAYVAEAETNGSRDADEAQHGAIEAAAFVGRLARAEEDPFEENGTIENATTQLGLWIEEQIANGTIGRTILDADDPIRNETVRLGFLAQHTLLETAPCYALARDPTGDGRYVLLQEDMPMFLRHVDGALAHADPDAAQLSPGYELALHAVEDFANATGVDIYEPLPRVDDDILDEAWGEVCPTIDPVWPCVEGSS